MTERNTYFDFVKGILIIMVVAGHCLQYGFGSGYTNSEAYFDDPMFRAIYSFHMPLFMLISGYFFSLRGKELSKALSKRLTTIGVPWLFYSATTGILQALCMNSLLSITLKDVLVHLCSGLWFLSSILLNCCLIIGAEAIGRRYHRHLDLGMMGLIVVLIFCVPDHYFPATHKFMYPFFLCGYLIRRNGGTLEMPRTSALKQVAASLTLVLSIYFFRRDMYIYTTGIVPGTLSELSIEQFMRCVYRFAIGFVASFCFLLLCANFKEAKNKVFKVVNTLGRHTLPIYGLQSVLLIILVHLLQVHDINLTHNYLIAAIETLLILLICECIIPLAKLHPLVNVLITGKGSSRPEATFTPKENGKEVLL